MLRTDYKNDELDLDANLNRRFRLALVEGESNIYEITDVTEYLQEGDTFDAEILNEIVTTLNSLSSAISSLNQYHTFNISSASWVNNTDATTSTTYPQKYVISSELFSDNSHPIWQLNGTGDLPTDAERDAIALVTEAEFSDDGITLYALNTVSVNLVLEVKGI